MAYKTRVFFFCVRLFSQSISKKKKKQILHFFFPNRSFAEKHIPVRWSFIKTSLVVSHVRRNYMPVKFDFLYNPPTHAYILYTRNSSYGTFFPTTPLGIIARSAANGIRGIALPQLRALAKPLDAVESRRSNRVIRIAFSLIYLPLFFFCRIASLD